jgi:hypothetical protein
VSATPWDTVRDEAVWAAFEGLHSGAQPWTPIHWKARVWGIGSMVRPIDLCKNTLTKRSIRIVSLARIARRAGCRAEVYKAPPGLELHFTAPQQQYQPAPAHSTSEGGLLVAAVPFAALGQVSGPPRTEGRGAHIGEREDVERSKCAWQWA